MVRSRLLSGSLLLLLASLAGGQTNDPSTPPIIVEMYNADYPRAAKAAGIRGDVVVLVLVDKKGKAKVVDSYGPMTPCSDLDDKLAASVRAAAVEAAMRTVFLPATFKGKAVDKGYTIKYAFEPDEGGSTTDPTTAFLTEASGERVRRPVVLKVPKAHFPDGDAIGGVVDLKLLVYEDGHVHSVEPLSGHKAFRRPAMEAACKAIFRPALLDGRPVKFEFLFRHNFYTVFERL